MFIKGSQMEPPALTDVTNRIAAKDFIYLFVCFV